MKLGEPLPARLELIRQLAEERDRPVFQLRYQGQLQRLPIYRVPLDFPKYRLNNGRTQAAQLAWLAKNPSYPSNFFTLDQESDEAQVIQHDLLKGMITSGTDLQKFFSETEQDQPFILTHQGFILNGNRRICSLRELINSDATYANRYGSIDIVVLPVSTEKDWDELEARLQIVEDIQLDYSWTATAVMLRSRRDEHHYRVEDLAALYKMTKPEVEEYIDMLSLGEDYLVARGNTNQYALIDKDEFAFRQLRKHRMRVSGDESKKDVFQLLSYLLIDEPDDEGESSGRVYAAIPKLYKHLDPVVDAVKMDLPEVVIDTKNDNLDLLGVVPSGYGQLATGLREIGSEPDLRRTIIEVIEIAELIKKETDKRDRSIVSLERAEQYMKDASAAWTKELNQTNVVVLVDRIIALAEYIRGKADGDASN